MNVLIIEDEVLTADRLKAMLTKYDPTINILAKLSSIRESIQWLRNQSHLLPDLIFMDLHLEDGLAFKIIEELDLTIPIIFTTAYSEYALKAFKANSVDYLLKPIDPSELASAINKFSRLKVKSEPIPDFKAMLSMFHSKPKEAFKDRFLASVGNKLYSIQTADIAYFSIEQKSTFLKTFDERHLAMDFSLDKLVPILDPKLFFRINRSYIVSLSSIRSISVVSAGKLKLHLTPSISQEVFVSGDRISDFKEWLGR